MLKYAPDFIVSVFYIYIPLKDVTKKSFGTAVILGSTTNHPPVPPISQSSAEMHISDVFVKPVVYPQAP